MPDILRVSAAEAIKHWDFYEPRINDVIARARGGETPDDILSCVQLGSMQIWRTADARGIAITQIQDYPRYRLLLVYMVAGEHAEDWLADGHQHLEAFAKSSGCNCMEFQGRPGWEKFVRALGYDHKLIRMRKELGNG